jgi:hypothetical protein
MKEVNMLNGFVVVRNNAFVLIHIGPLPYAALSY